MSSSSIPPSQAAPVPRVVTIDMTSDNICPWCYIGKRRLERAIRQLNPSKVTVRIRHHPFFLDASLPKESIDKLQHYQKKFGEERAAKMLPKMIETGLEEGIQFSYGGRIGSTLLSHRLVAWVQKNFPDRENALVDALFLNYFEKEKDISNIEVLADIAASIGCDRENVISFLSSKELEPDVQKEVINAYRNGVEGVPDFLFDGQYKISGGEKPEVFLNAFQKLGVFP